MSATTADVAALADLAGALGVQTSYADLDGADRSAGREALAGVLRSLGAHLDDAGDARGALLEWELARARRGIEPVLVAWGGVLPPFTVTVPEPSPGPLRAHLSIEHGAIQERTVEPGGRTEVGGQRFATADVDWPETVPPGVHSLAVEAGAWQARSTVISAPVACFGAGGPAQASGTAQPPGPPATAGTPGPAGAARTAAPEDGGRHRGVFIPLYALHSHLSWGAGDFGDLAELAAWAGGTGADTVATLPLLAAFLGHGGTDPEPSPYAPVSRLFWNELYLDVEAVPEVEASPAAREAIERVAPEVAALQAEPLVDHARQAALQRQVLEAACDHLFEAAGPRLQEEHHYLREHPLAEGYARFRAAVERHGPDWRHWPAPLDRGSIAASEVDQRAARYHGYVQWLCNEQIHHLRRGLADPGVDLHLDLPLGSHPNGFDAWRFREHFATGAAAGAPPDAFFSGGQNWGFAPLHPEASRAGGHAYLRACLEHHMASADSLRIDHVMSLHRLYFVPEGFGATEGLYVRYPSEELYAVLSLLSHKHRCRVVGEDLGTVPGEVRESMGRHGVARTYVVPFEARADDHADDDDVLPSPPAQSLATLDTHDLPPFAAFWSDPQHGELRRALSRFLVARGWAQQVEDAEDGLDAGRALEALLAFLGASPAREAVVNLEDLWLEARPQNVPGTTSEHENWRRRATLDLETFTADPEVVARLTALVQGRPTTPREAS